MRGKPSGPDGPRRRAEAQTKTKVVPGVGRDAALASCPSPSGAAMIVRVVVPLSTLWVSGSPTAERMPGSASPALSSALVSTRAARGRAAEQRVERLLRGGAFGRARRAGFRRGQREVGRDHQRRLALHGELIGPLAVEHAAAAAGGQQRRAAGGED